MRKLSYKQADEKMKAYMEKTINQYVYEFRARLYVNGFRFDEIQQKRFIENVEIFIGRISDGAKKEIRQAIKDAVERGWGNIY